MPLKQRFGVNSGQPFLALHEAVDATHSPLGHLMGVRPVPTSAQEVTLLHELASVAHEPSPHLIGVVSGQPVTAVQPVEFITQPPFQHLCGRFAGQPLGGMSTHCDADATHLPVFVHFTGCDIGQPSKEDVLLDVHMLGEVAQMPL